MQEYNLNDKVRVDDEEKEVKYLTLEDLYRLYEKQKLISLVKIINGDVKLFIKKED
jgi:hypothetical protein